MNTPNTNMPYITPGTSGAEVIHNDAINRIDGLIHLSVERMGLSTSPSVVSPGDNGKVWKTAGTGVIGGDWTIADRNSLQLWVQGWIRIPIFEGMVLWDRFTSKLMVCTNAGNTAGVDSTWAVVGTQSATVAAVAAMISVADADSNTNFAELRTKVNAILTALKASDLMA